MRPSAAVFELGYHFLDLVFPKRPRGCLERSMAQTVALLYRTTTIPVSIQSTGICVRPLIHAPSVFRIGTRSEVFGAWQNASPADIYFVVLLADRGKTRPSGRRARAPLSSVSSILRTQRTRSVSPRHRGVLRAAFLHTTQVEVTIAHIHFGSYSFQIDVREPADVQAAFQFSRSTGIRLSIKNSGVNHLSSHSKAINPLILAPA